ncbi:MAG: hypothetical protein KGQ87_00200 [Verrucomicrobia bacterium]|nr:hypothetical protein [Verrucomicrobiota bacterium]
MPPLEINATVERLGRRREESKSQKTKVSSRFAVPRFFDFQTFDFQTFDFQTFDFQTFDFQTFDFQTFDFQTFDFQTHGSACQFVALFLASGISGFAGPLEIESLSMAALTIRRRSASDGGQVSRGCPATLPAPAGATVAGNSSVRLCRSAP